VSDLLNNASEGRISAIVSGSGPKEAAVGGLQLHHLVQMKETPTGTGPSNLPSAEGKMVVAVIAENMRLDRSLYIMVAGKQDAALYDGLSYDPC
jgi:hypothetical protein